MPDIEEVAEPVVEFPTDGHRDSHVVGLEWELKGYQAKVEGSLDELVKAQYVARISGVKDEIKRITSASKPGRGRAASKPAADGDE